MRRYYIMEQSRRIQQPYFQDPQSTHSSRSNMETDVHLTKKKRIVFWVYLFAVLCFLGATVFLISYAWTPINLFLKTDSYYFANQVTKQWQKGFIVEMQVTSAAICPAGYEYAVNYQWAGSSFGCYCNSSTNLSFVLQGYCSPGLIQVGCSNMASKPSLTTHFWTNNATICIKRSTTSFYNEKKYDGTVAYKTCGNSQSVLIMPTAENCPFVNVTFGSFSLEDHQLTVVDIGSVLGPMQAAFNSTSPYSFYSYPISKFSVSEYQFCEMDDDTGVHPNHSDFILLNRERGCSSRGNYTLIDSTTESAFYSENPALAALVSIKGFPSPGNWAYNLGFASLPSWTYQCRHNYNGKFSIPVAVSQFNFSFLSYFNNLVYGEIVACVVAGLVVLILTLRRCINSAVYPVGYKQRHLPQQFCVALLRYIIDAACKLSIFSCAFASLWSSYTNYNWFKSAMNIGCPDGDLQLILGVMEPFMSLFQLLFQCFLAQTVLTFLMMVADIVHFIYIYRAELNHYLIQTEDKLFVKKEDDADLNNLKWMELRNDQVKADDGVPKADEEFRLTAAQNIFSREYDDELPQKLKKKKKKKIQRNKLFEKSGENPFQNPVQANEAFSHNYLDAFGKQ